MDPQTTPTFATHYFVDGRPPFLNLSDLAEADRLRVLAELETEQAEGRSHRTFGSRYMELRRRTEAKMRALFIERGGVAERKSPHYFVLGTSRWFAALSPTMREVRVPLSGLPRNSTSITYPDSFVAMRCGVDFGLPDLDRPYVEKVFLLNELDALVQHYGMPDDQADEQYAGYEFRELEKFIEIQVWTDAPILDLVAAAADETPH